MNWKKNNEQLERTVEFEDFKNALSFVNKVGFIAEEEVHHPTIEMHDYNQVTITLTTHDDAAPSGGQGNKVTDKDYRLAERIDEIKPD